MERNLPIDINLPININLSHDRMDMNLSYEIESPILQPMSLGVGNVSATYILNPDKVLSKEDAKEFKKEVSNLLMDYIAKATK